MMPRGKKTSFTTHAPTQAGSFEALRHREELMREDSLCLPAISQRSEIAGAAPPDSSISEKSGGRSESLPPCLGVSSETGGENDVFTAFSGIMGERPAR